MKKSYAELLVEYNDAKRDFKEAKKRLYKKCKTLEDERMAEIRSPDLTKEVNALYGKIYSLKSEMNKAKMREMNKH